MTETKTIDLPKLHRLVANDIDVVTEMIERAGMKSWMPMFILHCRDGSIRPYAIPFEEKTDKDAVVAFMREQCIEHDAESYVTVTECWYLEQDSIAIKVLRKLVGDLPEGNREEFLERAMQSMPPPSAHPDRREGIAVGAFSATHGVTRILSIERDEDGKMVKLLHSDIPVCEGEIGKEIKGRMVTLLRGGDDE
jgi:hypothetical protein